MPIDQETDKTLDSMDAASRQRLKEQIRPLLDALSEREREVVVRRLGLLDGQEYTLKEIADHFGIARERIRQIEERAVRKLRQLRDDLEIQATRAGRLQYRPV